MKRECESCIKRKTPYCPNSTECMATDDMPYYQNRIMLLEENKQLKEQLLVAQTNEETFRLEMEEVTKTLGLDEDTIFDDVKVYARSLKDNWNKLKEHLKEKIAEERSDENLWLMGCYDEDKLILEKMEELEQGSDSNE